MSIGGLARKATLNRPSPIRASSSCERTAAFSDAAVREMSAAMRRYPSLPYDSIADHVAAISPPDRLPPIDGDEYIPPGQPLTTEYTWRRSDFGLNSTTELPFSA